MVRCSLYDHHHTLHSGFGEVGELSRHGRIFTSALILTGVGTFAFVFTAITQAVVAGQVSGAWQKRKLEKKLHQLRDHYIVCGYGRVGATLVERLRTQDRDVIVIDADTENEELITGDNVYFLHGDAVRELTLREAGIERAAGISFCLPSDADNLFGVLSAAICISTFTLQFEPKTCIPKIRCVLLEPTLWSIPPASPDTLWPCI